LIKADADVIAAGLPVGWGVSTRDTDTAPMLAVYVAGHGTLTGDSGWSARELRLATTRAGQKIGDLGSIRDLLAGAETRRCLLICDDATVGNDDFRHILNASGGGSLLITSRADWKRPAFDLAQAIRRLTPSIQPSQSLVVQIDPGMLGGNSVTAFDRWLAEFHSAPCSLYCIPVVQSAESGLLPASLTITSCLPTGGCQSSAGSLP
jgi:hypothetical protein